LKPGTPTPGAQSPPQQRSLVLGVLVPCRDEAAVIGRKLANLAAADWPAAPRAHRVVVVDDGSRDGTGEIARARVPLFAGSRATLEVLENVGRPGKSGALEVGLASLRGQVDLLVLSDADVILEPAALAALSQAFASEAELGMACGTQRFVRSLADDGTTRAAQGGELADAAGLYDRWTALVRRLESRRGRLFSVHGQLLAWRASLGLAPTPGLAADDLDLMLQARLAPSAIRLVPAARFLEVKTPAGAQRRAQELRRARAYLQFLRHPRMAELARRGGPAERLQVALYRRLPPAAPWLFLLAALLAAAAIASLHPAGAWLVLALIACALLFAPARRLARLLRVIARARRAEARLSLTDRWETPRA
jgi:hypothetical protein